MLTVHASAFTFLCICGSYRITAFDFFLYTYATYVNPPSECGCYECYTLTILLLAFNSCLKRCRIAYPRLHSNCMCICHGACGTVFMHFCLSRQSAMAAQCVTKVELTVSCDNLLDKDIGSKSDPLCVLLMNSSDSKWYEVSLLER